MPVSSLYHTNLNAAVYDALPISPETHCHSPFHLLHPLHYTPTLQMSNEIHAVFNPNTFILFYKRHLYAANLSREMSEDSKNAFLHCGYGFGCH